MKSSALLITLALMVTHSASTIASDATAPEVSIEACQFGLTDAGRRASFSASAIYRAKTDSSGEVDSWNEIRVPGFIPGFVDIASFECCVRRWVLSPQTTYTVVLNCGTTGEMLDAWTVSIVDADGGTIRMVLPRGKRGCNETGA